MLRRNLVAVVLGTGLVLGLSTGVAGAATAPSTTPAPPSTSVAPTPAPTLAPPIGRPGPEAQVPVLPKGAPQTGGGAMAAEVSAEPVL